MKKFTLTIITFLGISTFILGIASAQTIPPLILTNQTEPSNSYHVDVPIPTIVYWVVAIILACGGTTIVILKKLK